MDDDGEEEVKKVKGKGEGKEKSSKKPEEKEEMMDEESEINIAKIIPPSILLS